MQHKQTILIYLIGTPGTGKYTIAQEFAKAGYIVCDNQLVNNPIFTLLNYDGFLKIPEYAWDSIGAIRNVILDFIANEPHQHYVLTNVLYEDEGDRRLFTHVEAVASKRGALFIPVKLLISEEENKKRIVNPERRQRWKSINPADASTENVLISIEHPHVLELEVTHLTPAHAAEEILAHIKKIKERP